MTEGEVELAVVFIMSGMASLAFLAAWIPEVMEAGGENL